MKKTAIITLTILFLSMLLVACNPNGVDSKFDTVTVNLKTANEDATKSLNSSFTAFDKDNYYWRYTAEKKDAGSKTGEQTTEKAVKTSGKGLGALDGEFATGKWTFSLFAYSDDAFTKKVYSGSVDKSFTGTNATETVSVSVGPLCTATGTLVIEKLSPKSGTPATTTQIAYIVGGTTNTSKTDFPTTITDLSSGTYTVTIELSYTDGTDTFKTASEPIQVTVYDNLTTTIRGDVDDLTSHVELGADGPFTVTFDSKGGSSVASVQVEKGGKVTTPTDELTKTNYLFGGWYKDTSCTDAWNFDTDTVTADTTLYAKWIFNGVAFTATEGTVTIGMSKIGNAPSVSLQYSYDGTSWSDFKVDETKVTVQATGGNNTVYIQAQNNNNAFYSCSNGSSFNYFTTSGNGKVSLSGNIMALLDNTGNTKELSQDNEYAFMALFRGCKNIEKADSLVLPATELSDYCYSNMFADCSGLKTAPALPATTLAGNCYFRMFDVCTSLTSAPALPATILASSCYYKMFQGCSSLTSIGVIGNGTDAVTLALDDAETGCMEEMFSGCSSLNINKDGNTDKKFFTCPSPITGNAVSNMFKDTTGDNGGAGPTAGTSYYWYTSD